MGAGSNTRSRDLAIRVYKLQKEGVKTKDIAEMVGKNQSQIKALRELGERLVSIERT
jgi:predicted transcriptional regulator